MKTQTALECAQETRKLVQFYGCQYLQHMSDEHAAAIIEAYAQQRCAALVEALERANTYLKKVESDAKLAARMPNPPESALEHLEVCGVVSDALAQFKGEKADAKR